MNPPQTFSKDGSAKRASSAEEQSVSDSNVKSIKESGKNLLEHVKEDTKDIAQGIAAEGNEKIAEANAYAADYVKKLEGEVTKNPIQAVAIAFAAGYVLNSIFSRR